MIKINVIGTSGSGKSTFAKKLAGTLAIKYIEMDALFWKPHWQESSDDEFLAKIQSALNFDRWVLDGNYSRTQPIKWQEVDTIIWLDYGFARTFSQVLTRSIKRAWNKNELWQGTGNKESFYKTFFHKDSIILWMLKNYHRNKLRYQLLQHSSAISHIKFIRIKNVKQAEHLLTSLERANLPPTQ